MIAQLDIFSEIASYLDYADNFVYTVADAYHLPGYDQLVRGIVTFRTFTLEPSFLAVVPDDLAHDVAKKHPHPEILADYILTQIDSHPNFDKIMVGLSTNDNWTIVCDDRFNAVRFMAGVHHLGWSAIHDDTIRLCKYDCVMQEYFGIIVVPPEDMRGFFHGRSLMQMYRLARCSFLGLKNVATLASMCSNLDRFLRVLHREGDRGIINYILIVVDVGYDDFIALTEKYLA